MLGEDSGFADLITKWTINQEAQAYIIFRRKRAVLGEDPGFSDLMPKSLRNIFARS